MENINIIGIDLAKTVFQLHGVDKKGNIVLRKRLTRKKLLPFIMQLPACQILMEACGSAHYWARSFIELGHEVKLISPQYVKPFVKGNKTDRNDSEAIVEAGIRPSMRFVPIKSLEQHDIQSLHRIREQFIARRTGMGNQIRGLLAEYGITVKQGIHNLRQTLPSILEDGENKLTIPMRGYFHELYEDLKHLDTKISYFDNELKRINQSNKICQRLNKIEGVGPMTATAILALGDLRVFKNGRHLSAFLGLVPKQFSSGNKQRLGRISKRGNSYFRKLLIQGAQSVTRHIKNKTDPKSLWLKRLIERRGKNRACCALANKNARTIWVIATKGISYDVNQACMIID